MMMTIISHRLAGYWGALRMCHSQSSIYWAFLAANLYHHIHSNMAFPIFLKPRLSIRVLTYAYPGPERRTSRPSSSMFLGCNHTTHPSLGNADASARSLANSFHKCWHKAITRRAANPQRDFPAQYSMFHIRGTDTKPYEKGRGHQVIITTTLFDVPLIQRHELHTLQTEDYN